MMGEKILDIQHKYNKSPKIDEDFFNYLRDYYRVGQRVLSDWRCFIRTSILSLKLIRDSEIIFFLQILNLVSKK